MKIKAPWLEALTAARTGDLAPALAARTMEPSGLLPDYFFGRALAEAGEKLPEAVQLLRQCHQSEPQNPMFLHSLALALARHGAAEMADEASAIWKKHGLPHDLDLLGSLALTLEFQARQLPLLPQVADIPWPATLPRPQVAVVAMDQEPSTAEPSATEDIVPPRDRMDKMSPAPVSDFHAADPAPLKKSIFTDCLLNRSLGQMEDHYLARRLPQALALFNSMLEQGKAGAEYYLVAGMAADEAGDFDRARACLARALELEPNLLVSRAALGRVYWHLGWNELALALWKSLPVEGPYDYGRHYFLALGHEALGHRAGALEAMNIALRDFFYDTRHFYIARALTVWQALKIPEAASRL